MSTGRPDAGSPLLGWVADVGGTHARFALVDAVGRLRAQRVLDCDDYPSLTAAVEAYLDDVARRVEMPIDATTEQAAVAVAGPVSTGEESDQVQLTNRPSWSFSIGQLEQALQLRRLQVVNDFTALALAVPLLYDASTRRLTPPEIEVQVCRDAPIALLGPGTGLGVGGLIPVDSAQNGRADWLPLTTEGGHRDLAATTEREWRVVRELQREFGRVSVERVLSGPGLLALYQAICRLDGVLPDGEPPIQQPGEVTRRSADCPFAAEAVALFSGWLGAVAGDLVLTLGARGGLFLGGGVVPGMGEAFRFDLFWQRYTDKGRFRTYVEQTPVRLILHPTPALVGLAALLMNRETEHPASHTNLYDRPSRADGHELRDDELQTDELETGATMRDRT